MKSMTGDAPRSGLKYATIDPYCSAKPEGAGALSVILFDITFYIIFLPNQLIIYRSATSAALKLRR